MSLNEQQSQAIALAVEAKNQGHKSFAILGGGGVGKTYTAKSLLKQLDSNWASNTLIIAPTNKALKVIKQSMDSQGIFMTVHSSLGLQHEYDEKGRTKFTNSKLLDQPLYEGYKIVLVDEISMVNSKLTEMIIENCEEVGAFLIGLGDQYQHFPVGEKCCPMVNALKENSYTLTKIMRQGGNNPIKNPIAEARKAVIDARKHYDPRLNYGEKEIYKEDDVEVGHYPIYNLEDAVRQIHRAYHKAYEENDFDLTKVICWRNKSCDQLNREIRQKLWGDISATDYIPGDLIICRRPVTERIRSLVTGKEIEVTIMHTSTEALVLKAEPIVKIFDSSVLKTEYKGWKLEIKQLDNSKIAYIEVLTLSEKGRYTENSENLRQHCIKESKENKNYWKLFFAHEKLFHDFKHSYTITSMLSQGSTYKNAFVWCDDISANNRDWQTRNRTHYVGISRAKYRLITF